MFRALNVAVFGFTILGLFGCGSSDPAANYRNLPSQPYEIKKYNSNNQASGTPLFSIDVVGQSDQNFANFYEGEAGSIKLLVTPLFPQITGVVLSSTDLPANAILAKSSVANTWVLSWTPPVGTVPSTISSISRSVHVEARPVTNDARIANWVTPPPQDVKITVTKTRAIPVVTGINGWKSEVDEGSSFEFSLDIFDPSNSIASSNGSFDPISKMAFDSGINKENYKLDLNNYIQAKTIGNLEDLHGGHWRRTYILDLTHGVDQIQGQVPAGLNSMEGCITFRAESAFGNKSNPFSKCLIIDFLAESPDFNFDGYLYDYQPIEVTAGTTATIKFNAAIKNKQGVATVVVNKASDFSSWAGHPQLACLNGDNNDLTVQNCTITWQIPCKAKSKYNLLLTGTNTKVVINGKVRTSNTNREIDVLPPATGCADTPASSSTPKVSVSDTVIAQAKKPVMFGPQPVAKGLPAKDQTVTQSALKDQKAQRADKQVGALPAKSTIAPPTTIPADSSKKSAHFVVQGSLKPNATSPNKETQHSKLPMAAQNNAKADKPSVPSAPTKLSPASPKAPASATQPATPKVKTQAAINPQVKSSQATTPVVASAPTKTKSSTTAKVKTQATTSSKSTTPSTKDPQAAVNPQSSNSNGGPQ